MFKWFAYDPDFVPNNYDTRFKNWTENGLTAYCTLFDQDKVLSFQDLKEKFGLHNQDHFRYLQIRDFTSKKFPRDVITGRDEILIIFQRAYKNVTLQKIISKLYSALQNLKSDHTLDIKERWEAEGGLTVSQEDWDRICRQQWSVTSSPSWREFSWKNVTRFFRTPAQMTNYSNQTACWRSCGNTSANHFHVFWNCPSVTPFWREIIGVLEAVFKRRMFLNFKVMYLCDLDGFDPPKGD